MTPFPPESPQLPGDPWRVVDHNADITEWDYVMTRDYTELCGRAWSAPPGTFHNRWGEIGYTFIRCNAGYAWSGLSRKGCTGPTAFHDFIYQFAEDIAAAWGWSVWRVLQWANGIMLALMQRNGVPWAWRNFYYAMPALFGYLYHEAHRANPTRNCPRPPTRKDKP